VDKGLEKRLSKVLEHDFVRVTYTEAVELLETSGRDFQFPVAWGMDLQSEHERCLCEEIFNAPVIVCDYPAAMKPFYMRQNDDNRTVAAMDVLFPGVGEIAGGSQREERYERLEAVMRERGMDMDAYRWYLDLRRFGSTPHSGFGVGFERLILFVTGIGNIRDAIPFPRTPGRIGP
jgi:asparaginyl-tRNA synthetase